MSCPFTDPESVKGALQRLYNMNECVLFWNEEHTFKLMLRNDPDTPENNELAFELVLIVDDEDEGMVRMLELLGGGCLEEPGIYVLHEWMFDELTMERAGNVMARLNAAYFMKICPCGEAIIKDEADTCCLCHMKLNTVNKVKHFCAICHSEGMALHMTRRSCGHYFHTTCLAKWDAVSAGWCPVCKRP